MERNIIFEWLKNELIKKMKLSQNDADDITSYI